MSFDTLSTLGPTFLILCAAVGVFAGFIKGATGWGMPTILISGLGSFLSPELALAGLAVPTLVSNLWLAMRQGPAAALASARTHLRFLITLCICLLIATQLVALVAPGTLFLLVGVPLTFFALVQLAGWRPQVHDGNRRPAEYLMGVVAGTFGGMSGAWGPPTVLYLMAMNTPKQEAVRVQGVLYGVGSVLLAAGLFRSGVLNADTVTFSTALLLPTLAGMLLGFVLQDRLDQTRFRRLTLIVLIVAGLNLIRRGLGY